MNRLFKVLLVMTLILATAGSAFAVSSYMTSFTSTYPGTSTTALNSCNLCHTAVPARNSYGAAYASAGHNYRSIESLDSDGDGFTNLAEINARTFPGDASSRPAGDVTAPVVSSFTIPATATTLTVSITGFTATDSVGVTGYAVTETNAAPAAGWSATPQTSYTFASAGAKTLYAWARDAAGNVSASRSASVTITLPVVDTTAPVVSSFTIPATATTLTVSITGFTATDNVGVTGYMITETATAPLASAAGWSTTAPASRTFTSAGVKTLYAWAKDAAGNVSASRSATVTITITLDGAALYGTNCAGCHGALATSDKTGSTAASIQAAINGNVGGMGYLSSLTSAEVQAIAGALADRTAPAVSSFTIPATATTLTVSITGFTATDNVGVTGYAVTETNAAPAAGWSATPQTSYTFTSAGAKTLYAWARDAAGNVSASRSASVTITLPVVDTTAPVVSSFTIPATATTLTVSITGFTATDNVGVTGYAVTETNAAPAAGWSATPQTSYTFTSAGAKTLYAWARDAAGNVSASRSASVIITLPAGDSVPPVVTSFSMPATSSTLKVPISSFTATDNVGVTGYRLTMSSVKPLSTSGGWSTTPPTSKTFATAGTKTLYAWAKDAAGNVSLSRKATVTISLSTAGAMPVPSARKFFSYEPVATPVMNSDPSLARPVGIGALADNGNTLTLHVSAAFGGPVDLYLTVYAPEEDDEEAVSSLDADDIFKPYENAFVAWKKNVKSVNQKVLVDVPVADLYPGTYTVRLKATPAGSKTSFYLWSTSFVVD